MTRRLIKYALLAILIPLFALSLLFASITTGVKWVWSGEEGEES